jgi:hypothetical protein
MCLRAYKLELLGAKRLLKAEGSMVKAINIFLCNDMLIHRLRGLRNWQMSC